MSATASEFFVYTQSGVRLGEIRSTESVQWLEEYAGCGEVKIVCGATENNRALLRLNNLIRCSERPDAAALICAAEITDDGTRAQMTVRARLTACRLAQRVAMYTAQIGNAESGMLALVQNNLRGLPLAAAAPKGLPERYDGPISWGSVLEGVQKIAVSCGLGFRVSADPAGAETFEVYRGKDRTDPASPDYIGFFGDAAGNLGSIRLASDSSESANFAVVCGKGEGAQRTVVTVDCSEGGPVRELYADADDIPREYTDAEGVQHLYTPEEYAGLLRQRGLQKLAGQQSTVQLKASLRQSCLLFGRDYGLGDILPLRIEKYGIRAKVRVAAVKMICEQSKTMEAILEVVL